MRTLCDEAGQVEMHYHGLQTHLVLIGRHIPDWPKLLHLYSRFKTGKTVFDWMKTYEVEDLGIDVRRFTSFGVVKVNFLNMSYFTFLIPNLGVSKACPQISCLYAARSISADFFPSNAPVGQCCRFFC